MYKSVKILDPEAHGFYRYTPATDFYYAKTLTLIPITFSEIKFVCCDYPVIVIIQEQKPQLMLLCGITKNNAINEQGVWLGDYIPAFLRRYPFTLVEESSSDVLHIGFDLESGLFSSPEGQPLFDAQGAPSNILEETKKLLSVFQHESSITQNILLQMHKKEILSATEFSVQSEEEGKPKKIGGFFTIDKKKLFESEDGFLLEAVRNGWMEMIELQHLSLKNVRKLG